MQNYIAYGMSYFNAIVGLPHDTIMLCNYVLRDMLASSDSLHQAIVDENYRDIETWNVIRFGSILNMQLFYTLNGMNNQPPYKDEDLNYSVLCQMALDSITNKGQLTDKELFQDANLIGKSLDLFGIGNLGHNSINEKAHPERADLTRSGVSLLSANLDKIFEIIGQSR
jgi:hypothetical protein